MCNLYSITRSQGAIAGSSRWRVTRRATCRRCLASSPRLPRSDRPHGIWQARADDDALGDAGAAAIRWRPDHQHPQHVEPALARLARSLKPMPGAGDIVLRMADTKPKKTPTWFALDVSRPLFAFAGIWTPWRGVRGTKAQAD